MAVTIRVGGRMNKYVSRMWEIINQDVKDENETKRFAVVLRMTIILLIFYFITGTCLFMMEGIPSFAACCFVLFLSYSVMLCMTYYMRATNVLGVFNGLLLGWIVGAVLIIGWDIGIQHFLFVLLLIYMFSNAERTGGKLLYASFLLLVRMFLYQYCRVREPIIELEYEWIFTLFQMINSIFVFVSLSIISYRFSITSRELETKLVMYNRKLEHLATTDGLTGLMNRRTLVERLEKWEEKASQREMGIGAIAIADIDFFKKINDTYGHECGDMVLIQLSSLMEHFMEDKGVLARWGGEEFLFVFRNCNGDEAYDALFELQSKIRKMRILYKGETIAVTMTFGLQEYDYTDYQRAITEADKKLYMGKNSGRDRIIY